MFPLNDFNFVCCALATFSAAVGYKYSQRQLDRRRSTSQTPDSFTKRYLPRRYSSVSSVSTASSTLVDSDVDGYPSDSPSPSDFASDETEPGSLKRKHRDETFDNRTDEDKAARDHSLPPPQKRCRSLTPEANEEDRESPIEVEQVPTNLSPAIALTTVLETGGMDVVEVKPDCAALAPLFIPQPETAPATSTVLSPSKLDSTFTIPACKPSTAFSAFAGASSGFTSGVAPSDSQRPSWCTDSSSETVSSPTHPDIPMAEQQISGTHPPPPVANNTTQFGCVDPLQEQTRAQSLAAPALTGEEDEDVRSELKGIKLFIKRGNNEFTDGILGHVKLLSHKSTNDERIVFRREPVWKVSMSVRLRPTIRCNFDEGQGVLRIILKERIVNQEGGSPEGSGEHVVMYVLRRGKVSKNDFASFARSVAASTCLVASPDAAPSSRV